MSCTFWNMRRRLKAQKRNEKVIANIAAAQAEEKQAEAPKTEKKTVKKGGAKKNDETTD